MDKIVDEIIDFCKFFKSIVKDVESDIPNRTKVITFIDILYYCIYMNGNSCSYSMANINMFLMDIFDVTDSSLIQKRNSVNFSYFKQISNSLGDFFIKNNTSPRIFAVDGSYIPLSIDLKKYGFLPSKKNTYCVALVSSLFDVINKVLINYRLRKNHNEREALMNQIGYLKPDDILIMDRGYFGKKLLFFLNSRGIKVIFRMKDNGLFVKEIVKKGQSSMNTTISYCNETIQFRIISYKINNNSYFLGTTIMNHTVEYFKDLYWKRWTVETNFRESKYLLSLRNILSRDENKVRQDIYTINILFLIGSFFRNRIQVLLPDNQFVNTKNLLSLVTNNIIHLVLYKKITDPTKKEIEKVILSLLKRPILCEPNRHYERIRIKPIGKWYYCVKHEEKLTDENDLDEIL
jgi:hypothetical protein